MVPILFPGLVTVLDLASLHFLRVTSSTLLIVPTNLTVFADPSILILSNTLMLSQPCYLALPGLIDAVGRVGFSSVFAIIIVSFSVHLGVIASDTYWSL